MVLILSFVINHEQTTAALVCLTPGVGAGQSPPGDHSAPCDRQNGVAMFMKVHHRRKDYADNWQPINVEEQIPLSWLTLVPNLGRISPKEWFFQSSGKFQPKEGICHAALVAIICPKFGTDSSKETVFPELWKNGAYGWQCFVSNSGLLPLEGWVCAAQKSKRLFEKLAVPTVAGTAF